MSKKQIIPYSRMPFDIPIFVNRTFMCWFCTWEISDHRSDTTIGFPLVDMLGVGPSPTELRPIIPMMSHYTHEVNKQAPCQGATQNPWHWLRKKSCIYKCCMSVWVPCLNVGGAWVRYTYEWGVMMLHAPPPCLAGGALLKDKAGYAWSSVWWALNLLHVMPQYSMIYQ